MSALTLADARRIIAAAEKKADEIGQPVNIAVIDAGGNLMAHVRQDGACIGSIDISISKAWTSRAFDIQTKDLGDNSQPTQQFCGIHATNGGKVAIFAGGVPLTRDGVVTGGLGVSGGSGEQDQGVALALYVTVFEANAPSNDTILRQTFGGARTKNDESDWRNGARQ
jgi:uncharacterized protein GlcG (DUF336 family)